jgi:hypothetical protein
MKIINQARLDQLSCEAVESGRLRKNLNMHDADVYLTQLMSRVSESLLC